MKNQCWLLVQQSEFWIAWLIPRDEEDLALLASLLGDEVEVVDAVSALVGGEGGGEVVVGEVGLTELLDDDLLLLLVYPEDEEAVAALGLVCPVTALTFRSHGPRLCLRPAVPRSTSFVCWFDSEQIVSRCGMDNKAAG